MSSMSTEEVRTKFSDTIKVSFEIVDALERRKLDPVQGLFVCVVVAKSILREMAKGDPRGAMAVAGFIASEILNSVRGAVEGIVKKTKG